VAFLEPADALCPRAAICSFLDLFGYSRRRLSLRVLSVGSIASDLLISHEACQSLARGFDLPRSGLDRRASQDAALTPKAEQTPYRMRRRSALCPRSTPGVVGKVSMVVHQACDEAAPRGAPSPPSANPALHVGVERPLVVEETAAAVLSCSGRTIGGSFGEGLCHGSSSSADRSTV